MAGLALSLFTTLMAISATADPQPQDRSSWEWAAATPESQGMVAARLDTAWAELKQRRSTAFLVIRHDRIVFERYADGYSRTRPHYTASMAKALVGGLSLMVAMGDGRIRPDDPASRYVPHWRDDPKKKGITIRHLATHTSGIEDAEADDLPHDRLTGWKGDFWKRLPPPHDPITISRDLAPVLDVPGTRERYSNPGMGMLGYCITASLKGTDDPDLRSLLKHRIMTPLGLPDAQWVMSYGTLVNVDNLPVAMTWGGGTYTPDAVARVGRLLLHRGTWEGQELIPARVVDAALKPSGMPGHSGLAFWVNTGADGSRLWKSAPPDAFGGEGAGHQCLLVIPSLDLIVVRNGDRLDSSLSFMEALDRHVVAPVIGAIATPKKPPHPPSPAIKGVHWAPERSILRKAQGSDTWPLTWAGRRRTLHRLRRRPRVPTLRSEKAEPGLCQGRRHAGRLPRDQHPLNDRRTVRRRLRAARRPAGSSWSMASSTCGRGTPATRNWPGLPTVPVHGHGADGGSRRASDARRS